LPLLLSLRRNPRVAAEAKRKAATAEKEAHKSALLAEERAAAKKAIQEKALEFTHKQVERQQKLHAYFIAEEAAMKEAAIEKATREEKAEEVRVSVPMMHPQNPIKRH